MPVLDASDSSVHGGLGLTSVNAAPSSPGTPATVQPQLHPAHGPPRSAPALVCRVTPRLWSELTGPSCRTAGCRPVREQLGLTDVFCGPQFYVLLFQIRSKIGQQFSVLFRCFSLCLLLPETMSAVTLRLARKPGALVGLARRGLGFPEGAAVSGEKGSFLPCSCRHLR